MNEEQVEIPCHSSRVTKSHLYAFLEAQQDELTKAENKLSSLTVLTSKWDTAKRHRDSLIREIDDIKFNIQVKLEKWKIKLEYLNTFYFTKLI